MSQRKGGRWKGVMNNFRFRAATAVGLALVGAGAHAALFYNVIINSAPLSNGASFNTVGNSIHFNTPNAIVMDGAPNAVVVFNIQYDADMGAGNAINQVDVNLATVTAGTGRIDFSEQVFVLDVNNNEVGGAVGTAQHTFTPNDSPFYSTSIALSTSSQRIRAKKTFVMQAPDVRDQLDLAALAICNQNVVPEPTSIAALGLGALVLLRRRNK